MYPSLRCYLHRIAFLFCLWFVVGNTHAQWVSIPDTNFGRWLNDNSFSSCVQGNNSTGWELDTTCNLLYSSTLIRITGYNVKSFEGIQYFKSLEEFVSEDTSVSYLPQLPSSVKYLTIANSNIDTLYPLPVQLRSLISYSNKLRNLPLLPGSMEVLHCYNCQLTHLPALPNSLIDLDCSGNLLTQLPILPPNLYSLSCSNNLLSILPTLPSSLKIFSCDNNPSLDSIPLLPDSLNTIYFSGNNISKVSHLPNSLKWIDFSNNAITGISYLPDELEFMNLNNNLLSVLPELPSKLKSLYINRNVIDSLPNLPDSLEYLSLFQNKIKVLPTLPNTLVFLECAANYLSYLPKLPSKLENLNCSFNHDLKCLPQLPNLLALTINNTEIKCLPNYPSSLGSSYAYLSTYPICSMFDTFGCDFYYNISGKVYNDITPDCIKDINEGVQQSVKLNLLKNGVVEQQFVSTQLGDYTFDTNLDTYEVAVDTTDMPYTVACPSTFSHTVTLTPQDSVKFGVDFGLRCKPGFDVGVLSVVRDSGILFPAQDAGVYVQAGDLSTLYGLNCATNTSGTVTITYSGPVSFAGVRANSLVPTVAGNTLTYNIADFSTVDIHKAFGLRFVTDTFAQIGQELCLTVMVTPVNGDNNPSNNTATYCFPILNSYDPNMKEVSPVNSILPAEDWLTYTIHFQNMGNAPAIHIYVLDTLDANLDEGSIQITGSSHRMITEIKGKVARFNFPNINLIDSATNEPESKGWLQYKIKKKENLALGTPISNTASIYFDFNAPVVTNTVTTTVEIPNGIAEVKQNINLSVHPNPTNNLLYIHYTSKSQAEVSLHTINGTLCNQSRLNHSGEAISLSNVPVGIYFVTVTVNGTTERRKVVKY